jgi:hypothetical protein
MNEIWEQLKAQLEYFSKPFPQVAIDLANAHRSEVAPYLIDCLAAIGDDPSPTRNQNYMLHLYAMHLLAAWRDRRAYLPMVRLGRHPDNVVEEMMGDVVTETYGRALASVCDGDMRPLEALAEDVNASYWARGAALNAMVVCALEGEADRTALIAYLSRLGDSEAARLRDARVAPGEFELIDSIVSNATDLGAVSMLPAIRQWFADTLLDESIAGERWVAIHIARSPEECLSDMRRHNDGFVSDVATEMGWWAGFRDDPEPVRSRLKDGASVGQPTLEARYPAWDARKPETFVRDTTKIGRNDPCYCDSGRKYKKCHGFSA